MSAFSTLGQEASLFLSLNNDILRIAQALNSIQDIKKLLYYKETDPLSQKDVDMSLVDKTIWRVPLLPLHNETDIDAGYISVNLLMQDIGTNRNSAQTTIAIDVWVPPEQWIISNGLRPLVICDLVEKTMKNNFVQTSGVKYRLEQIINSRLDDRLLGFRMIYETILEN